MNQFTAPVTYFIATGWNFGAGLMLLTVGAFGLCASKKSFLNKISRRLVFLGLILLIFTTAVGYLPLALLFFVGLLLLLPPLRRIRYLPPVVGFLFLVSLGVWLLFFGAASVGPVEEEQQIYVLGDSLAAGCEVPRIHAFPARLQQHDFEAKNLSFMGATAEDFLEEQERLEEVESAVAIVGLGGNELLRGVPAQEYGHYLEKLTEKLLEAGNRVLIFELPLPLFANRYGVIKRRLARRSGVELLPRWLLARPMFWERDTQNGIHLSKEGHDRLAKRLARLLTE